MIRALLAILLHAVHTTTLSLSPLTLPPWNNTAGGANFTAHTNRIICGRAANPQPFSDFSACVPSLFSLYNTPLIHTITIWDPGEMKQWGPETDLGGCFILLDGGQRRRLCGGEFVGTGDFGVDQVFCGGYGREICLGEDKGGTGE